jgi:hypothetical protein
MKALQEISQFAQYLVKSSSLLSQVFSKPFRLEEAVRTVKDRLANREKSFLETIRSTVYEHRDSPYLRLLSRAGWSFDRLSAFAGDRGIEECLTALKSDGVYMHIEEFKGKKETVRGTDVYRFSEKDFNNPRHNLGYQTQSGGSRSAGSRMTVPMEAVQHNNIYGVIAAHEYGIMDKPVIIYLPILPAGEGLFFNLRFTAMSNPPVRWFSQVDDKYCAPGRSNTYKTRATVWMARLHGIRMPGPQFVDIRDTVEIARWMKGYRGNASGFTIVTYASSALRLVLEAKKEGIRFDGTVFWLMGEPLTPKIYQEIRDYGCTAYSLYGCNELMIIGHGCVNPVHPDDMHLFTDKLAVIQSERQVGVSDQKLDSFYFTTLMDSSPKIFLNTETGDYGVIEKRKCGCGFEKIGLDTHIHTVRSFEKLTAEGATFLGHDLIALIQEILPREFGGSANDYQVVEEADEDGFTRLFLIVSPRVGPVDEQRMKRLTMEALMGDPGLHLFSRLYWERADTFRIKRTDPIPTKRGKILPLYIRPTWNT